MFKNVLFPSESTECEPLEGWGFRRGGYQCRCRPGFRLPNVVRRPFLGEIVERASPMQVCDCLVEIYHLLLNKMFVRFFANNYSIYYIGKLML